MLSYSTVSSNSFGTIKIITTKDFCSLSDQNCVDKKCNYFDKCPLPFDHKCGKNICARKQTDCEMYLNAKFHFKTRIFKDFFIKEMQKQEVQFKKFQINIANCSFPKYVWNSTDGN